MSLLANRQPLPKIKPVRGKCRWILPIEGTAGVLAINGTAYAVTVLEDRGAVIGYRLQKAGGSPYDINSTANPWTCDCPDALYRQRECKHVLALRAALAVLGQ
jgi:hypothetical protein